MLAMATGPGSISQAPMFLCKPDFKSSCRSFFQNALTGGTRGYRIHLPLLIFSLYAIHFAQRLPNFWCPTLQLCSSKKKPQLQPQPLLLACQYLAYLSTKSIKKRKITSLLHSRYYIEACNEWRDPSPRLSACMGYATSKQRRSGGEPLANLCRFD